MYIFIFLPMTTSKIMYTKKKDKKIKINNANIIGDIKKCSFLDQALIELRGGEIWFGLTCPFFQNAILHLSVWYLYSKSLQNFTCPYRLWDMLGNTDNGFCHPWNLSFFTLNHIHVMKIIVLFFYKIRTVYSFKWNC